MSADLFSDLGLAEGVAAAAEEAGFDTPTAIQEAAIPLLRRGNNVVVIGAPGSGARSGILLALIDRLIAEGATVPEDDDEETAGRPRALILTPTADDAARVAGSLSRLGASNDVRARSLDRPDAWPGTATVAVGSLSAALDGVRTSGLKLDGILTVVIDGFDSMRALGQEAELDTLLGQLPAEAQRVLRASVPSDALDDFAQRALRRAMRVPGAPADRREAPANTSTLRGVELSLVEVPSAYGHDALATLAARGPLRVHFRSASDAAAAARELTTRGFELERLDATITVPAGLPSSREVEPLEASFGAPGDATVLAQRHRDGGVIVVDPRELTHVRMLVAETGATLRPVAYGRRVGDLSLDMFRDEVRRALEQEDLSSQMLVLEPLLDEYPPAEVAAALSALLRARRPTASAARGAAPTGAGAPPPAKSWTRLYIGIGKRDDVRAGDLVGAITGEANVTGEVIGKIDLRDTFSVVEIEASAAQHVIDSLNGKTLRSRALRVDYDRQGETRGGGGGDRQPRDDGNRSGPPRGGGGGGPRGGGGRPSGGGRGGPGGGRGGPGGGRGGPGGGRGGPGGGRGGPGGGRGGPGGGRSGPGGGRGGSGGGRGPQGPRRGPPRDHE